MTEETKEPEVKEETTVKRATKKRVTKKKATKKAAKKKTTTKRKPKAVMQKAPEKDVTPPKSPSKRKKKKPEADPTNDSIQDASNQRDVVYPDLQISVYSKDNDQGLLTADDAKYLLGWEEPSEEKEFEDYMLLDTDGKTIVCTNNVSNRYFNNSLAERWKWEILRGHWEQNGETMKIGKTGITLDCQHRLVGLVLAVQEWKKEPERFPYWDEEPCIPAIVVVGIEENRRVVNTINVGKTRTVADAIYASGLFYNVTSRDAKALSRVTDLASRHIMLRSHYENSDDCPYIENAEVVLFLETHPRILESIQYVFNLQQDSDFDIGRHVKLGYCAAFHYLMATSKSDPKKYDGSENSLDFSRLEKSDRFWVNYAEEHTWFSPIFKIFNTMDNREFPPYPQEKYSVLVNAWKCWIGNKKPTPTTLSLKYSKDESGFQTLAEYPLVGGIDTYSP